ncbi:MAG: 5-methylcytosine restriction system specificity protein McrC, partial [Thermoplasmata archaeon]
MLDVKDIKIYEYEKIHDDILLKEIISLNGKNKKWSNFINIQKSTFYFKHYVGIVQIGNFRISILPKIWTKNGKNIEETVKNLFKMLLYTYHLPSFSEPALNISSSYEVNDIFELLVLLYANTLEKQMNEGIYRKYVRIEEESKYIRGKLNLEKQLNRIDKSFFDITNFRFSANNDMNRYFAYSTTLFLNFTSDQKIFNMLKHIEVLFRSEGVSNNSLPDHISFNRLN